MSLVKPKQKLPTFTLERIGAVVGKQRFDKLVVDGVAPFDVFEKNLEEIYKSELTGIYATMNKVAACGSKVPDAKYKMLKGSKDGCNEYEFKSKHLRVYCIEAKGGEIVVTGGTKVNQDDDIRDFRNLKRKYLESLKNKRNG